MSRLTGFRRELRSLTTAIALPLALGALIIVSSGRIQAQTFTVLHTFTGAEDGGLAVRGLTIDRSGNLYGTGLKGGSGPNCGSGCGTVFKLTRHGSSWTFATLYSFEGGEDGTSPSSRAIIGPDGALYGTTLRGGTGNCGTNGDTCGVVYRLSPPPSFCRSVSCPWSETVLYRFNGSFDGGAPAGDPTFDSAGNLYGTAEDGGYGVGVVFELTPYQGQWPESVVYSFSTVDRGVDFPGNGVIFDGAGNLMGTTTEGGQWYEGTVFQLSLADGQWTESVPHQFDYPDGVNPWSGLLRDAAGNFYGTTNYDGPYGCGTVYQLSRGAEYWNYNILYAFSGGSGSCGAIGGLVMDAAGNLYGTTSGTGAYQHGTVFKLSAWQNGWTYTTLHDFTGGTDGTNPWSTLVIDGSGNLYGTTTYGGGLPGCNGEGCGVVFEVSP